MRRPADRRARGLRHALRAEDIVARLGGDEYVAVVEDLRTEADAAALTRAADAAMYLAQRHGRARYRFCSAAAQAEP